jgi:hypothetical protein
MHTHTSFSALWFDGSVPSVPLRKAWCVLKRFDERCKRVLSLIVVIVILTVMIIIVRA